MKLKEENLKLNLLDKDKDILKKLNYYIIKLIHGIKK